jgi:hypothetical protein
VMAADKGGQAPADRKQPESRLNQATLWGEELQAAHIYLDSLSVPRLEREGHPGPIEERLRALFGDRPTAATVETATVGERVAWLGAGMRPATVDERLAALETHLMRLWGYISDAERAGGERLQTLQRIVNGLTLSQISAVPRDMIRL